MDPHSGATKWAVVDFVFFCPKKSERINRKKGSQGRDLMNGDFRQVEGMMMLAGKRRAWDTAQSDDFLAVAAQQVSDTDYEHLTTLCIYLENQTGM